MCPRKIQKYGKVQAKTWLKSTTKIPETDLNANPAAPRSPGNAKVTIKKLSK